MTLFTGTSIEHLWDTEQWSYIRKNIGEWHGVFVQFSPDASWVSKTPSVLTLIEDHPEEHMTLVLKRMPQGKQPHTMRRELGYPGAVPYICFFPTGAFAQGAMQRRPWSSFGAEFSLLSDNCRMRLVQLYKGNASGEHTLDYVTLIPECRYHQAETTTNTFAETVITDQLSIDSLSGTWQGQRIYLPATMTSPQVGTSYWQAQRSNGELKLSYSSEMTSLEHAEQRTDRFVQVDNRRWQDVGQTMQLWLLPNGVSCTLYPKLARDQSARLEFCWYLSSQQRQRLVRDYDAAGNWTGTALMLETRL